MFRPGGALTLRGLATSATAEPVATALAARVLSGTGTPEGAVAAPVGTIYQRTNGGADSVLYAKETGTGNTGWSALAGV